MSERWVEYRSMGLRSHTVHALARARRVARALASMLSVAIVVSACARRPDSSVAHQLSDQLQKAFKGQIWTSRDASAFVDEFYSAEAVGTMAGAATVWKGHTELTSLMTEVMKTYAKIDYTVYATASTAPRSAYQFVLLHAIPFDPKNAPLDLKCLYVWRKGVEGWRVMADLCSPGGMDK